MKNLATFLVAILLAAWTQPAIAQGLVLRAGANFQNINGKDADGDKLENDLLPGFNAGLLAEVPLAVGFYFQPGLLFSTKGTKTEDELLGETITSKVRLGYLEVPFHLLFKPMVGNGHFMLGFGPYVGFGLTGKATTEVGDKETEFDVNYQNDVDLLNDPIDAYYFRRLDAGANLFAGYEFAGGLSVQLNTQLGLLDIHPDYKGVSEKTKWNNTGFGLSLGYRIGP